MRDKTKNRTAIFLYLVLVTVFFSSCSNNSNTKNYFEITKKNYTEQKIGIIVDVTVVPTSWNENIKVQVKTNDKFFVVHGLPQLSIGDSITTRIDGNIVTEIMDCKGEWYKVY